MEKKHAENVHQKLVTESLLILLNNPKQPLYARNFLWRYFGIGLSKSLKKVNFIFSFEPSPF